jgi:hypothetical protein
VRWYFGFFLVSGFCSILYELIWLRLAMAQFAVTTALVSIGLSAFMIGLGLGSFLAGRGWITAMVLDGVAQGDPDRAGVGYAINIAGCVFGPLVSGFVLLPLLARAPLALDTQAPSMWKPALVSFIALALVTATNDYETRYSPREVRRDSTATVTAVRIGNGEAAFG